MRRREFIRLIGGAAAAWPLSARAQKSEHIRRIGLLLGMSSEDKRRQAWLAGFIHGLRELDWVEGRVEMPVIPTVHSPLPQNW